MSAWETKPESARNVNGPWAPPDGRKQRTLRQIAFLASFLMVIRLNSLALLVHSARAVPQLRLAPRVFGSAALKPPIALRHSFVFPTDSRRKLFITDCASCQR